MKRLEAKAFGIVQGVFYRAFARRHARTLGITGTVRNLEDGSVEVIAEGDPALLIEFLGKLKEGSFFSKVQNIQAEYKESTGGFSGFNIEG
ncbi:MAG: hypothetical protein A2664_04780 [Candidatus Taylorbacteria bacterium RIFCSPHIGHO2_01_FULL_46_22b]|uniref:acylphosphatase n=1 Tax=Candidatus Taylorbacteria bacterium RIFCSPHIGHO2_01_FULL_46_22b TaxID=1802301 RepID=A0A1G2M6U8_9BACT|nr:MAG: hypothetical protein A2664_04780 [Candidatus Taylorbacteria bacterium RIFCSPHIGHO2_01_FULL_46_22b]